MLLKRTPFYLLLLPVFFVLNVFTFYYDFVPVKDSVLLILAYCSASIFMTGLAWLYYKNVRKAALLSFILMSYHLFFAYGLNVLFMFLPDSLYPGYGFVLPVSLLLIVTIILVIKRMNNPFYKLTFFLNLLLLLFLVIGISSLFLKINRVTPAPAGHMSKCEACNKPDIYLIILDEYTSNTALKEKFNFDNSDFTNDLAKRGFHVISNSVSNYHSTPYSMASMLNMEYLNVSPDIRYADLHYCYRSIRDNTVTGFFKLNHYDLYNYSLFDLDKQPSRSPDYFMPRGSELITRQTFLEKLKSQLFTNKGFITRKKVFDDNLQSIESFIKLTKEVSEIPSPTPKFVYTHLLMPHFPYYYDSLGNSLNPDTLTCDKMMPPEYYSSYLKYCNKRILELTDHIIAHSKRPPLIILAGDHGYRDFPDNDYRYKFMNLQAVLLPSRDYKAFYDHLSAVNLFRIVLNTEFRQQLPLLKDSVIYLQD